MSCNKVHMPAPELIADEKLPGYAIRCMERAEAFTDREPFRVHLIYARMAIDRLLVLEEQHRDP